MVKPAPTLKYESLCELKSLELEKFNGHTF